VINFVTMRLFVGVELTDSVRDTAAHAARILQQKLGSHLDARWVPSQNMHITVRFIGQVADDRVPALLDTLIVPVAFEPFEVEFGTYGKFPPRGGPRAIWIGLTKGLPSLTALHEDFNRRLAPLGYEPENRPYRAHLTLARIKNARAAAAKWIDAAFEDLPPVTVAQRVETLTLFESRLSPRGPTYTNVRRLPLHT
jgi:2'-5' RNA ligase